ncbi:MAG: hypothetical protein ACHQU0_03265 [Candidatus Paceibacteria bacterium]
MQIIDLLKKLIASEKSEREIGNLAAAETFAAKAQELLTKHKLEMTDVEFAAEEANEPIIGENISTDDLIGIDSKKTNDRWHSVLFSAIADANFCKVMSGKSNRFVIVGRATDRATTAALFTYLSQACIEMARRECSANRYHTGISIFGYDSVRSGRRGSSAENRAFVSSFKTGFAVAIYHRLQRKKAELKAGAQQQGLIRIDQMEKAVAKEFKNIFPGSYTAKQRVTARNARGYDAGKSYGQAVGINNSLRLKG